MTRYVALLRAINVGGHRKIKMEDLRRMFADMGFENVATYIQSGNVVFDASEKDPEKLSKSIEREIEVTFGHEVPIIIRTPNELKKALQDYPFEEQGVWKGYISFLAENPAPEHIKNMESFSSLIERFQIRNLELYSLVDKQTEEKPLFSNNFIEKQLDMSVTTRNLRTVRKILELAAIPE